MLSPAFRWVLILGTVAAGQGLTMDQEATEEVIQAAKVARDGGSVAIVIRGTAGTGSRREVLLQAESAEDNSITVYYFRKTNKVELESLHGGSLKSVKWDLGKHSKGTLTLVVAQGSVKLIVGCKSLKWHGMPGRHLVSLLSSHKLKLYHIENAPIEVYSSESAAQNSLSCNIHEDTIKTPSLMEVDQNDMGKVKQEQMQGDDYRTNFIEAGMPAEAATQRGDIPSSGIETCDDEVVRQLTLLRQTIENLRREVGDQKGVIDNLRGQLRQCCHRPPAPAPERCSGTSCYPGY